MRRWLSEAHPELALTEVQPHQVKEFLLHQAARGIAPSTRATMVWTIRSLYNYLFAEELIPINPTDKNTTLHLDGNDLAEAVDPAPRVPLLASPTGFD